MFPHKWPSNAEFESRNSPNYIQGNLIFVCIFVPNPLQNFSRNSRWLIGKSSKFIIYLATPLAQHPMIEHLYMTSRLAYLLLVRYQRFRLFFFLLLQVCVAFTSYTAEYSSAACEYTTNLIPLIELCSCSSSRLFTVLSVVLSL